MSPRIKVVGIGGAGCNLINGISERKISGVELIALNTDAQVLSKSKAHKLLQIGKKLTQGLGCGMDVECGKLAAEESGKEIAEVLKGADLVFIVAGLGGGTGSGAAPVVAELAQSQGSLVIGIFTKPFSFEGLQRLKIANEALSRLREKVDAFLIINQEKIISFAEKNTTFNSALTLCDEVVKQTVQSVCELIGVSGIINVDFSDVRAVIKRSGLAVFGIGQAKGEKRIEKAIKEAINPLLTDFSLGKAKAILFNIAGKKDLSLAEVEEAAKFISKNASKDAKIIFGATNDPQLEEGAVKITLIVAGLESD